MDEAELQRLDNLTPKYKCLLDNLSPQKRKVLTAIAREENPLRVIEITRASRLHQQNRASASVYRLKINGLLTRNEDGRYTITDPDLKKYIRMRSHMGEYSPIAIAG